MPRALRLFLQVMPDVTDDELPPDPDWTTW
jgi:hypothetical protein